MSLNSLLTTETKRAHRGRWFVYSGGQKLRHQATMRGHWPGWDVECSCGEWASHTGGATRASVEDAFFDHRYSAQTDAGLRDEARAAGVDPDDLAAYVEFLRNRAARLGGAR